MTKRPFHRERRAARHDQVNVVGRRPACTRNIACSGVGRLQSVAALRVLGDAGRSMSLVRYVIRMLRSCGGTFDWNGWSTSPPIAAVRRGKQMPETQFQRVTDLSRLNWKGWLLLAITVAAMFASIVISFMQSGPGGYSDSRGGRKFLGNAPVAVAGHWQLRRLESFIHRHAWRTARYVRRGHVRSSDRTCCILFTPMFNCLGSGMLVDSMDCSPAGIPLS